MLRTVFFKGNSLSLAGRKLKPGDIAPNFHVCTKNMKDLRLSDLKDQVKILTSFISLDTPVCDVQVKQFNQMVSTIGKNVQIFGLSKDLPFAQNRFCSSFSIANVQLLSDFKMSSFGINYGLLIKEWNLLARAVVIVDSQRLIRYIQVVPEITAPPNYDEVLKNLETVLKSPKLQQDIENQSLQCIPCKGKMNPLSQQQKEKYLSQLNGWNLVDHMKLEKQFQFQDFASANSFLDWIGCVAEEQGHHPTMSIDFKKVKVALTTHAVGDLTENDFMMAQIIDQL